MMDEMDEYDAIYLQMEELEETTWCADKINNTDIKYLLSTPKRAAAEELYEAVRKARQLASIATDWNLSEAEIDGEMVSVYDLLREFEAAVALADGNGEE